MHPPGYLSSREIIVNYTICILIRLQEFMHDYSLYELTNEIVKLYPRGLLGALKSTLNYLTTILRTFLIFLRDSQYQKRFQLAVRLHSDKPKTSALGGLHCRHIGGKNKRKFAHVVCIKMEVNSQRRKILLFHTTNMAAMTSHAINTPTLFP